MVAANVDRRVIDTIIAEALGEGDAGMTAVAFTILNRANNRHLTPLEVVQQPNQYSGYSDPGSAAKRAMGDPKVRARVEAIWNAVQTGSVPDPTSGGEYFHTTRSTTPKWAEGMTPVEIGSHTFYKGSGSIAANEPPVPQADIPNILDVSGEVADVSRGNLTGVDGLVIHHTAGHGTVESVVNALKQRGLGIQYIMDRDGQVYRVIPEGKRAAHFRPGGGEYEGLTNDNVEGIEVIAKDDNDLTPEQIAAFPAFANWHSQKYGYDPKFVVGHGVIAAPYAGSPFAKQETEGLTLTTAFQEAMPSLMTASQPGLIVPPRRPDTGALAAINDAISAPEIPATAYAPSNGSLSAPPLPAATAAPALPSARYGSVLPGPAAIPALPVPPRTALTVPSVSAPTVPASQTIQAQYVDDALTAPAGPLNRGGRRPPSMPRLSDSLEWKLSDYAENYVPTDKRPRVGTVTGEGLTVRPVTTIPVTPNSPLAGNMPDLKTWVEQEAERRRVALQPPNGTSFSPRYPEILAIPNNRDMTFPALPGPPPTTLPPIPTTKTLQPLPVTATAETVPAGETIVADYVPGNGPTGPKGRGRPRLATPPIPKPSLNAFGYEPVPERLTPGAPLEPKVPYGPPMPPKPPTAPGSILTGAIGAPLGATTKPGMPSWRRGVKPEEMTNPSVYEVLAGINNGTIPDTGMIPSTASSDVIRMANSPGANFLGEVNAGKRPFANLFMRLFAPREGQIATSRSINPPRYRPASAEGPLSGAQIDIARRQSGGDGSYEDLIKWTMS